MLDEVVKVLRKHPLLGPKLVAINAVFFFLVYGVYALSSKGIALSRPVLFALARGDLLQRSLIMVILAIVLVGLPLLGYVVARLAVLRLIEQAQQHKVTPWNMMGWRVWALLKSLVVGAMVAMVWLWALTLLREEIVGWLGVFSAILFFGFCYLWLQALALVDPRHRPVRSSLDLIPLLFRSSWPLVSSSLGVVLIVIGGFYLGGNFWAGSFSKVVYVTTKEWGLYVFLFRATLLLVGLLILSVAQLYFEGLRPDHHKKAPHKRE